MGVGSYVHSGRCFDLTDTGATWDRAPFHQELKAKLEEVGSRLPDNRAGGPEDFDLVLRNLDCAVLNFALGTAEENHGDGKILGYFRPAGGYTGGEEAG